MLNLLVAIFLTLVPTFADQMMGVIAQPGGSGNSGDWIIINTTGEVVDARYKVKLYDLPGKRTYTNFPVGPILRPGESAPIPRKGAQILDVHIYFVGFPVYGESEAYGEKE
jgi:hypothetical protein